MAASANNSSTNQCMQWMDGWMDGVQFNASSSVVTDGVVLLLYSTEHRAPCIFLLSYKLYYY